MSKHLEPAGNRLELVSCGVRQILWMQMYTVGLYLPAGAPLEAALDPRAAAALRVRVLDARSFPDKIPEKWRRPMEKSLSAQAMGRVRSAYARLWKGDDLTLVYVPGKGVAVSVNGRPLAHASGHRLIDDMLQVWADDDAVEGKLRRLALEHPC